ncbi:hypothetical protein HPB52_024171 [Rhipicephalus sanguineus]|uniref:Uncharacterized protein n=1 Tax=Rhipicephalus sanguineus TaxID=34632 RepID=A0A9D4T4U8_RHISA|nr:hypothetical protein HPB52_024171 [Rhipicephalus sanguineus]
MSMQGAVQADITKRCCPGLRRSPGARYKRPRHAYPIPAVHKSPKHQQPGRCGGSTTPSGRPRTVRACRSGSISSTGHE